MKVLETDGLQTGIQATKKEITTIQNQIAEVQRALSALLSLEDSFKGKTAESIFSFYKLCHELFLNYMLEFLNEYHKVLGEIQEATQSYEPHARGFIREDFIEQDVTKALKQLQNKTDDLSEEANRIMKRVNDIVSLKELDTKAFEDSVGKAKKKGKNTVEKLHKLDQNQMKALKSPEEKFEVMRDYLSQMRQSMRNPSWEIPNFHFGKAVSMPAHSVMYQHVYKEELDKIATELKEKEKKEAAGWFKPTAKGAGLGIWDFVKDTGTGIYEMGRHPIQTVTALHRMKTYPIQTAKLLSNSVIDSIKRDIVNGNTESRAHWVTYSALSVLGTKGTTGGVKATTTGTMITAKRVKAGSQAAVKTVKDTSKASNVKYKVVNGKDLQGKLKLKGQDGEFGKGKENYQHLKDYKDNKYFTSSVEYNAGKDGTGFTYKIYQRGDINWGMVRTKGAKKGRGLTNADASAKYGLAPILDDVGSVATLHHSQQKGVGPLYEASTRYHNISNAKRAPLHPYKGKLNPFYPMDETTRGAFQKVDSINYWKIRGKEALGGK